MSSARQFVLCLFALVGCLLTACQGGRAMKYYNFPDAVTNINQVDPSYRKYFADQQGRNYSADDQRKALAAAIRTARTPVPAYVPRSAMASSRKAVRKRSARSGRTAIAKRKAVRGRRAVAKRKTVARSSRKAVTRRKAVARKRAVVKRKVTSRRRRG
ncbi:MAG: hypothetical protein IKA23_06550 [Akkermansia sp.]|nr:hypothetical protein [Akkermansia sp.]